MGSGAAGREAPGGRGHSLDRLGTLGLSNARPPLQPGRAGAQAARKLRHFASGTLASAMISSWVATKAIRYQNAEAMKP